MHSCHNFGSNYLPTICRLYFFDLLNANIKANIHLFQVNITNIRKRCEICLKLTIKTLEDVIDAILVFLLLTENTFQPFSSVSIVNFEQVNVSWDDFF